ncbi:MAG: phage integrase SAM-like domain-containing protein [Prolixibacteraceae bacterium]
MHIRFYLGRTNTNGYKQIRIQVILNNDKFWIKTKHYVEPHLWNQKKQSHQLEEINNYIKAIRLKFSDIERDAVIKSTSITKSYVISRFHDRLTSQEKAQGRSFIDWFDYFQEKHKNKMSEGHLRKFPQVKTHLTNYGVGDFKDITLDFYDRYIDYLSETGLSNNTVSKHLKCIIAICKDAEKEGLIIPRDYMDFKGLDYRIKPVWLTKKEIDRVNKLTLKGSHKHIWNDWLFKYYTGIRNSDMNQLLPEHFVERYIDFSSMKSRKMHKIPLHPKAYELAKSYDFSFPKYTLQYKNREVKEICKLADINTPVETVHYSSGKRIVKVRPKYELISSHTARRTFGRMVMDATKDIEKVRELLGHTSADTTRIYIGWEPEEIADAVNSVQF